MSRRKKECARQALCVYQMFSDNIVEIEIMRTGLPNNEIFSGILSPIH